MNRTASRLDRYVTAVTIPTMAAVGGIAAPVEVACAEIVYQGISLTVGGSGPASATFQVGTYGTFNVFAGSTASGGRSFGISNSSKDKVRVMNDRVVGESSKKGTTNYMHRWAAGEMVQIESKNQDVPLLFGKTGIGSLSNASGIYGNFATGGEGPQSGFIGFGINSGNGIQFGWISVIWDGTLLTIDGYAYETEVQTAIEAGAIPAPGAMGLFSLAAGAAGMRRKRMA